MDSSAVVGTFERVTRSLNFQQLAKASIPLSDHVIDGLVRNELRVTPGEGIAGVKTFFDQVPIDASDQAFISGPQPAVRFQANLVGLLAAHLKVGVRGVSPGGRIKIADAKRAFISSLEDRMPEVQQWAESEFLFQTTRSPRSKRMPMSALQLRGFGVQTADKVVDLIHDQASNVRANFGIQDQTFGFWVNWRSRAEVDAWLDRTPDLQTPVTRRIYLNPKIKDRVGVVDALIRGLEEQSLPVQGKFAPGTLEGWTLMSPPGRGPRSATLRADGIVLYVREEFADRVLEVALDVVGRNPSAFEGRKLPGLPMVVGPGIGVGDEPSRGSLTSHRSEVLESVGQEVRDKVKENEVDLNTDYGIRWARSVFRLEFAVAARKEGINPNNIAFNQAAGIGVAAVRQM